MSTYRLYTRTEKLDSDLQCIIAVDLTRLDFRSTPSLHNYVQHWFIDIDDFIKFMSESEYIQVTLIVSHLIGKLMNDFVRSLFPQIHRFIIVGKCLNTFDENVEKFADAQSLVDNFNMTTLKRQRLYVTFHRWPKETSTHNLNCSPERYFWFKYFFSILSQVITTNVARNEMLDCIRSFHSRQAEDVRRTCLEFEKTYCSTDIIKWYTRPSFFYLLLNRTLRSQDINHIFSMRYVIFDLENFINENRCRYPINRIYRGQQILKYELDQIRTNISGYIGLTAFWSTTRKISHALEFTKIWPPNRLDAVERVLFIIDILPTIKRPTFADISKFSTIECELEILFSLKSIFRIEKVERKLEDNVWQIYLTFIDEDDEDLISFIKPVEFYTEKIISPISYLQLHRNESKQRFFQHLTVDDISFLGFQLFIDIMLRLDRTEFARQELIEFCREYFANEPAQLKEIEQFSKTYDVLDAIQWYTKPCFMYRIINKTLRLQNVDHIFKLRYFIHDLHNQLAQMQNDYVNFLRNYHRNYTFYRGLRMNVSEFEHLKRNEGNLVSTNSFLSTTTSIEAARFFSGEGEVDDGDVSVIFEIKIDLHSQHLVPFSKVDYQSIFRDEDEVLFSIGAVFRIEGSSEMKKRLFKVYLTLSNDYDDYHWKNLTDHLT